MADHHFSGGNQELPSETLARMRAAPADKQGGGLTNDEIRGIARNYGRFVFPGVYAITEFECEDDFLSCVRAIERAVLARVAPSVPEATVYAECRECSNCGHVGINDAHDQDASCSNCDWTGPSPKEDVCPGCAQTGTMGAACPKCSSAYRLLCDTNIAAPQPSEKQVEPESPMKVAADALRRKAELEQAHQDGYRDGFKAAQAMLDKAEQPVEQDVPECNGSHDYSVIEAGIEKECTTCTGVEPPQPSEKQAEQPQLRLRAHLSASGALVRAHRAVEQPAEEARGVDALRIFKERLDELRDHDVSAAFHEIVAAARALLADPARCEQSAAATAQGRDPMFYTGGSFIRYVELPDGVKMEHVKGDTWRVYLTAPQAATGAQGLTEAAAAARIKALKEAEELCAEVAQGEIASSRAEFAAYECVCRIRALAASQPHGGKERG